MRIGGVGLSSAERRAIAAAADVTLDELAPGTVRPDSFDFLIVSSRVLENGSLPAWLRIPPSPPSAILLETDADYETLDPTLLAFRTGENARFQFLIRKALHQERGAGGAQAERQRALNESEERYRTLLDQAQDIVFSIDLAGRILSLNPVFETLTGLRCEDWIGRPFSDLLPEDATRTAQLRFQERLRGDPTAYTEYAIRKTDGSMLTLEVTAKPFRSDGAVAGLVGIARDVTDRKRRLAEEEREKRLASLGQLATSVAHEFNNVLMGILPFAEVLQRRYKDDARIANATTQIIGAVRRGREVSQEILRFARPPQPVIAPVNVLSWIVSIEEKARGILGPTHHVHLEAGSLGAGTMMLADVALAGQVVSNLLFNARDAMPSGGTLTLRARSSSDQNTIEIDVGDSGTGIPPDVIGMIFDPLFTTKRTGNGLGLAIAHQAMQKQNGGIRVQSELGAGTTFTLTFPLATPVEEERVRTRPRRILLVEDDLGVGEGLQDLLALEGFAVELVDRGLQGLAAVERFAPDLVLLDVNLPDISGLDVYEQLHTRWPDLPIIFSTGHADAHALQNLREMRVPSVMKPYDLSELLEVIQSL
jgi:PAS domain S-box-containing protein